VTETQVNNASSDVAPARDDWDRHWSAYREAAQKNPANRFRRRLVFQALALGPGPIRLLDIGSGPGELLAAVKAAHPHAELAGVELSREGIAAAQRLLPDARFVQRDLMEPGTFPAALQGWATHAVCSEVLEHVDDPVRFLANVRPSLAPGCRLVITVPGGPMSAFDRKIGHRRHYTADALATLLRAAGLAVDWVHGAGFPFFNLSRLAVVARGAALARDLEQDSGLPLSARAAMAAFDGLLRISRTSGERGWQIAACARVT
jgi:SAM-dependent methyltransferase